MARRTVRVAALTALATLSFTAPAFAHAGNPKYESHVEGVTPSITGFSVAVLSGDDRLEVVNKSTQTITIDGYNKDPYVRMAPDGAVSVNVRSPAYYLNNDRTATSAIPAIADEKAAPRWKVVAHDGRFQFHDHRIHWMTNGNPPQVTDTSQRTKVVDWKVPLHAGGTDGAIAGTLFWRGSSGGPPAGAFVALALLALLGAAAVVVVRRRRSAGGDAVTGGGPREEAW
ncbi:MAG TPA: hypothetical protein VGO80_23185 [Solirubrobacteraceae bacterium]|jgi:hypothetical protein|nr:hypothetical protein [Solirubrobacteraceae bacterium]